MIENEALQSENTQSQVTKTSRRVRCRKPLRVRAKSKPGRGKIDETNIGEVIVEMWDEHKQYLKELNEEEITSLRDHFNNLGFSDEFGQFLFDAEDARTFQMIFDALLTEEKKQVLAEMYEVGLITDE